MNNYISENRDVLKTNHYVRRARESDFWFDFTCSKVEQYRSRFGTDFCMVIYSDGDFDNAYIMPYREISAFFSEEQVDPKRNRWTGEIRDNVMRLRPGNATVSVSAYYNAFHYLHQPLELDDKTLHDAAILYDVGAEVTPNDLRELIRKFNNEYENSVPYKRITVSERVARPGAISDYIKKLNSFSCQICGQTGFDQKNGAKYIETHHISPLHQLLRGSYCSDNIIVVCPTCHMKLHYAEVTYQLLQNNALEIQINGHKHIVKRNIISDP